MYASCSHLRSMMSNISWVCTTFSRGFPLLVPWSTSFWLIFSQSEKVTGRAPFSEHKHKPNMCIQWGAWGACGAIYMSVMHTVACTWVKLHVYMQYTVQRCHRAAQHTHCTLKMGQHLLVTDWLGHAQCTCTHRHAHHRPYSTWLVHTRGRGHAHPPLLRSSAMHSAVSKASCIVDTITPSAPRFTQPLQYRPVSMQGQCN